MNEKWSFFNRWLRQQADLPRKSRSTLIYCTLQPQELRQVLDIIQQFEVRMNSGEAVLEVTRRCDKNAGTIEVFVEDSREMC